MIVCGAIFKLCGALAMAACPWPLAARQFLRAKRSKVACRVMVLEGHAAGPAGAAGTSALRGGGRRKKNPSRVANKAKRERLMSKYRVEKERERRERRAARREAAAAEGVTQEEWERRAREQQRTIESTREVDETTVQEMDEEVFGDERDDEFADVYADEQRPKVMITTRPRPSKDLFLLVSELIALIPHTYYYPRGTRSVRSMCEFAVQRQFTHAIVLGERQKECDGMLLSRLPAGPTAYFRVSGFKGAADIKRHGRPTDHVPELILNNFSTRLGRRVGRMLGSLFPQVPELQGRQVVTFHNQRDYIFLRHHRYIFDIDADKAATGEPKGGKGKKKAKGKLGIDGKRIERKAKPVSTRLQELGPQLTLKLRWLQEGTFDRLAGEYEWIHKRKQMDTSRRRFHL